jgi:hypothetical protein
MKFTPMLVEIVAGYGGIFNRLLHMQSDHGSSVRVGHLTSHFANKEARCKTGPARTKECELSTMVVTVHC